MSKDENGISGALIVFALTVTLASFVHHVRINKNIRAMKAIESRIEKLEAGK